MLGRGRIVLVWNPSVAYGKFVQGWRIWLSESVIVFITYGRVGNVLIIPFRRAIVHLDRTRLTTISCKRRDGTFWRSTGTERARWRWGERERPAETGGLLCEIQRKVFGRVESNRQVIIRNKWHSELSYERPANIHTSAAAATAVAITSHTCTVHTHKSRPSYMIYWPHGIGSVPTTRNSFSRSRLFYRIIFCVRSDPTTNTTGSIVREKKNR